MRQISRPNDLAPKGVRSTFCEERMCFNSTFAHIKKELDSKFNLKLRRK